MKAITIVRCDMSDMLETLGKAIAFAQSERAHFYFFMLRLAT